MATVKSFSLPDEAVSILNNIPKNERSEFVTAAILAAAQYNNRLQALSSIKNFNRFPVDSKSSVVDTLQRIRKDAK